MLPEKGFKCPEQVQLFASKRLSCLSLRDTSCQNAQKQEDVHKATPFKKLLARQASIIGDVSLTLLLLSFSREGLQVSRRTSGLQSCLTFQNLKDNSCQNPQKQEDVHKATPFKKLLARQASIIGDVRLTLLWLSASREGLQVSRRTSGLQSCLKVQNVRDNSCQTPQKLLSNKMFTMSLPSASFLQGRHLLSNKGDALLILVQIW